MGDFGGLADLDVTLYRGILKAPGRTPLDLSEELEITSTELDGSIDRLGELGLIRAAEGDGGGLQAISPMLAEATVLGAEDLELGARRASVEQRRDTIRRLVPDWNAALTTGGSEGVVDVVSDQTAIAKVLMHYAPPCEHELLSGAPRRPPSSRTAR